MTGARPLPRLHLVTDDAVLGARGFEAHASAVLAACAGDVALHLRGHATTARRLYDLARTLKAYWPAATILVNDRVDVALAAGADGVQLGGRSIAAATARALLGPAPQIGVSVHVPGDIGPAIDAADFVLLGAVWPTASHPGRAPLGVAGLRAVVAAAARPVVAIGGITAARIAELAGAGAYGAAALSAVWSAADPAAAARALHEAASALQ